MSARQTRRALWKPEPTPQERMEALENMILQMVIQLEFLNGALTRKHNAILKREIEATISEAHQLVKGTPYLEADQLTPAKS